MNQLPVHTQALRSEQRRKQLLAAAAECFRSSGFHGASIARISKVAGMSPGHIYHFFQNKEEIIAAIVEERVAHSLELIARLKSEDKVFDAAIENVDEVVTERTDPAYAGLWLEVLAEAARNPRVARLVQTADEKTRQYVTQLEKIARKSRSIESETKLDAITEVAMSMIDGLSNRVISNPDLDREEVIRVVRIGLQAILSA